MAQLSALPYYSTFRGTTNDKAIALSYELADFFEEDGMARFFFTSGGSDSVEVALKLARQVHRIRDEGSRTKYLSLKNGYHGTYSGHPVGVAAALAALGEIRRLRVHENASVRGKELLDGLKALQQKHDLIGDVRGEGLMCAIELVSDRGSKKPVGKEVPLKLQKATYEKGVMIRVSGNNVILSPPLVIDSGHVEQILSALDKALTVV